MDKMKTNTSGTTHNAGFPPAPPETRQQAGVKGQKRFVVLNNCRIDMEHDGFQWWNVKVTPLR